MARSLDGRVLAYALHDGALVLHADHPDQPVPLRPHDDARHVAVSPDGRLVATGSFRNTNIRIWNGLSGKLMNELPSEVGSSVCFSPDGKWLAARCENLRLWAVDGWQQGPEIDGPGGYAFSPDSKLLAAESGQGAVRLLDPKSGHEYARLEDPNQNSSDVIFTAEGARLVTTVNDSNSVHVWDLRAIRSALVKMGLDWDLPPYPPEEMRRQPPLQVTLDLGSRAVERPQEAITKYSLAIALLPLNPEAYLRRGRAYSQLKQWREAADDLGLAVSLNPGINDWLIWFELGIACTHVGRARPAVAAYSRCIELNPKVLWTWNNRGDQYEALGELNKALADFSKALELNASDAIALTNRSRLNARLGRWEQVVEDCSRLIQLPEPGQVSTHADAYHRRAGAYVQLTRYREAVADYQKALELQPSRALVRNDLAWLLANCPDKKLRNPARAVELSQQAIGLAESVGNLWNTLGAAHYRAGNWKVAIEALEKSIPLRNGGDAFDYSFLAMSHWRLGHKDEAQKWHAKAVQWLRENEGAFSKDKMHDDDLLRIRAEAEELLQIKKRATQK